MENITRVKHFCMEFIEQANLHNEASRVYKTYKEVEDRNHKVFLYFYTS